MSETSRGEEWCDCYWSCLVITARFITRERERGDGGVGWGAEREKVSYSIWGCKSGFWREWTRSERDRDRSLYPSLPRVLCDLITVVLSEIRPRPFFSPHGPIFYFLTWPYDADTTQQQQTLVCFLKYSCIHLAFPCDGAFLPVRSVTCNLCRDEVWMWCETKVCSVTLTTSLPVFVASKSVGVLGCLQRCVGVKHDLVGMCAHLCVFLFVWRQYCSWICQKLCSYWQATSCLSMSHKAHVRKHTTMNLLTYTFDSTVDTYFLHT